ncbi:MAG: GxxExxY protein [Candidatus Omnitrophica bacterium]|nr:GxxExxY protein [Candidatus Omnitrophota bacterium]MBU4478296.1 GxxExxY protein [Candidatus Omnitrophota bacterium]
MSADYQDFKNKELTEKIIKIFYIVYNKLGYGFLERVYENAMMIEFFNPDLSAKICVLLTCAKGVLKIKRVVN